MSTKKAFAVLSGGVLFFSLAGVCSKLASQQPFFSARFLLLYGAALAVMAVYAVVWQQALKILPLTLAYACKGMSAVWAILWGVCFFGERLRPGMLLAAGLIAAGVGLVVSGDGE